MEKLRENSIENQTSFSPAAVHKVTIEDAPGVV